MKAVAAHDRPREKLARAGASSLGDNELVAVVLAQGRAGTSVLDLANALLERLGGVTGVGRARYDDLMRVSGIGPARAAQLLAAVELGRRTVSRRPEDRLKVTSPRVIGEYLLARFGNRPVEQFGVVLLDTKHRLMRATVLSVGTLDASVVHPREIFREAIAANAAALVLFHNHPSGDPEPSFDDTRLTERFMSAGVLMGIDVLDHVILGDGRYFSYRERALGSPLG
jgi:DNA repair protein RadC